MSCGLLPTKMMTTNHWTSTLFYRNLITHITSVTVKLFVRAFLGTDSNKDKVKHQGSCWQSITVLSGIQSVFPVFENMPNSVTHSFSGYMLCVSFKRKPDFLLSSFLTCVFCFTLYSYACHLLRVMLLHNAYYCKYKVRICVVVWIIYFSDFESSSQSHGLVIFLYFTLTRVDSEVIFDEALLVRFERCLWSVYNIFTLLTALHKSKMSTS